MRDLNPRAWSIDSECWCTRADYDGYKEEWSGIVPVLAPDNRSKRIEKLKALILLWSSRQESKIRMAKKSMKAI